MCKCIKTTIKALLFAFNAILLLLALALLGVGIYCEVTDVKSPTNETTAVNTTNVKPDLNVPEQSAINTTNADIIANKTEEVRQICLDKSGDECVKIILEIIHSGGLILIIVSACIVIITIIGMCGASNQNKCLLGIYFALILILLIVVAVATIYTQTRWLDDLKDEVVDNDVIQKETLDNIEGIISFIDSSSLFFLIALMIVLVLNLVFACFFCKRVKDHGDFGPI